MHEGFRLISFWQAWADYDKFTGDVLNGGNTLLFEPGRFNMFYKAIQTTLGNEYTIAEAFQGRDHAKKAFAEFPQSVDGWGDLPIIVDGYLDPEYANDDPSNMSLQLAVLRGNIRQFSDMSDIFANYRAWHIMYFQWGYTGNLSCYIRSEGYRTATMDAYNAYEDVWGDTNYWYQVNFRTFGEFWLPLVGELDAMRATFAWIIVSLIFTLGIFTYTYKPIARQGFRKLILGSKQTKSAHTNKTTQPNSPNILQIYFGALLLPSITAMLFYFTFEVVSNQITPILNQFVLLLATAFLLSGAISNVVYAFFNRKSTTGSNKDFSGMMGKIAKSLYFTGIGFVGSVVVLIGLLVPFMMGGAVLFTAGYVILSCMVACLLLGLIWNYALLSNNIGANGWKHKLLYLIVYIILLVCVLMILTFPEGGIGAAIENVSENLL